MRCIAATKGREKREINCEVKVRGTDLRWLEQWLFNIRSLFACAWEGSWLGDGQSPSAKTKKAFKNAAERLILARNQPAARAVCEALLPEDKDLDDCAADTAARILGGLCQPCQVGHGQRARNQETCKSLDKSAEKLARSLRRNILARAWPAARKGARVLDQLSCKATARGHEEQQV